MRNKILGQLLACAIGGFIGYQIAMRRRFAAIDERFKFQVSWIRDIEGKRDKDGEDIESILRALHSTNQCDTAQNDSITSILKILSR